jgi:hypothetical protein
MEERSDGNGNIGQQHLKLIFSVVFGFGFVFSWSYHFWSFCYLQMSLFFFNVSTCYILGQQL